MYLTGIVAEQQLHLFDPSRPLLERFGPDFFRSVPRKPGVYIMSGEQDRVLYIGQSKNLRQRLASYKNAKPDRVSRKIIRLVRSVTSITWQECDSPEAAQLKENQLLRTLRPKFNKMNTYPRAYGFIGFQHSAERLDFWYGNEPRTEGNTYGAFKTGYVRAYATLMRTLWSALHQPQTPHDIPAALLAERASHNFSLSLDSNATVVEREQFTAAIQNYLAGSSDELLQLLTATLPKAESISSFQQSLHAADLEILTSFFEHGTRRNLLLRQKYDLSGPIIFQDELDDLLVMRQIARKNGAFTEGVTDEQLTIQSTMDSTVEGRDSSSVV